MARFEISTCFLNKVSDLDPEVARAAYFSAAGNEIWESDLFVLQTDVVFSGERLMHTNVRTFFTGTLAQANRVRDALSAATNRRWNAPTQDPDDRDKELGDAKGWGMFTTDGSRAVQAMVDRIDAKLRSGELSPIHLEKALETEREVLATAGHGEVFDTAVREQLGEHFDRVLEELGVRLRTFL